MQGNPKESSRGYMKKLDFMGAKFSFGFKTMTGAFQTRIGGVITLVLGALSLGFFAYTMIEYTNTESPIVNTSTELNDENQSFNLYQEDLYLMLSFSNVFGFIQNFQRFVTPRLRVYNMIYNSS